MSMIGSSLRYYIFTFLCSFAFFGSPSVLFARELQIHRSPREPYVRDEVLVQYRTESRPRRVSIESTETVEAAIDRFIQDESVVIAEPNYITEAFSLPNDPFYGYQWNLRNVQVGGIGLEEVWQVASGSGVVVAILDTGVAYENYQDPKTGKPYLKAPDFDNTCFVQGFDVIEQDEHPNDDHGHGTHVAGTVAQSTNNGRGVAGVAPGACLMPIKILAADGLGSYAGAIEGIYYAVDHGAQVVNLSLGGFNTSELVEEAVKYAYERGVTVVAATGNQSQAALTYPAAYGDYVLAVGASQADLTRASYSNYGNGLFLLAPGGNASLDQNLDGYPDAIIQQSFNPDTNQFGYYFMTGTSMAAPHVSGAVALLLSSHSATTPSEVKYRLQQSAIDLSAPGWDAETGWGLLNISQALSVPPKDEATLPDPTLSPSSNLSPMATQSAVVLESVTAQLKNENRLLTVRAQLHNLISDPTPIKTVVHVLTAEQTEIPLSNPEQTLQVAPQKWLRAMWKLESSQWGEQVPHWAVVELFYQGEKIGSVSGLIQRF